MKKISTLVLAMAALTLGACGGGANSGSGVENGGSEDGGDGQGGHDDATGEETPSDGETPVAGDGESYCTVTHFTSGDESRFRVQAPPSDGETAYDCIKCPGPEDVIKLTYTGAGFTQSLEFDGARTNGPGAASDELILEQSGNVCWSEDYDAGADLPSASAFTVDGHAATIEFDKGPDAGASSGTLSYYKNGVLQFAIPVVEGGELAAYPDDGVQLK